MTVAVVVLNWNGYDDTVACVDSVLAQSIRDSHVFLLDNGSAEPEGSRLSERFVGQARVSLLQRADNLGFAKGVSYVVDEHVDLDRFEHVALLNNDAIVEPDWLERLLACAKEHRADIVSSCLINYGQRDRLDNAGHIFLNTGEVLPRGAGLPVKDFQQAVELVGACAGACLISSAVIRDIGLFDEFFETGYEDAEFGLRAFLAGYRIVYAPDAVAYHKISRSVDRIRDRDYAVRLQLNINYSYLKLMPWPVMLLNAPFIAAKTLGVPVAALLSLRWRLLSVQLSALGETLKALGFIRRQRRRSRACRRRRTGEILARQRFFLGHYLRYFYRYVLRRQRTVFER